MNYKKIMLDRLLDKFERSKASLEEGIGPRRIMLKCCASDFPEYDIEKNDRRELINSIVIDLHKQGILEYEWMKYEQGNILNRVWLRMEAIEETYREAGRTPKRDVIQRIAALVDTTYKKICTPWIKVFLAQVKEQIEQNKQVGRFLPNEIDMVKALLDALCFIDEKGDEEYLERVFSIRCYGDSKFFEKNVKKRLIKIIKNYFMEDQIEAELATEDEILGLAGIVKTPEQVEFCGSLQGYINGKTVDFAAFQKGSIIQSQTVKDIEALDLGEIKQVLFIENKTNYVEYVNRMKKAEELVIFHGGFYSPIRGLFFTKVYTASLGSGIRFFHWGDIDVGGFAIYQRLKANIIPTLEPFMMDVQAFLSKEKYWLKFDEAYEVKVRKLSSNIDYKEFYPVLNKMLEVKCRLEQEAFL